MVDASHSEHEQMIDVTKKTLEIIGVKDIPVLYAFNKCDIAELPYPAVQKDIVFLSAKQRIGMDELVNAIQNKILKNNWCGDLLIPYSQGELVHYLNEHAKIESVIYEGTGTRLTLELKAIDHDRFQKFMTEPEF